jgi:hypothetical protein
LAKKASPIASPWSSRKALFDGGIRPGVRGIPPAHPGARAVHSVGRTPISGPRLVQTQAADATAASALLVSVMRTLVSSGGGYKRKEVKAGSADGGNHGALVRGAAPHTRRKCTMSWVALEV